jgi:putative ABC transport system substrate-binding protein
MKRRDFVAMISGIAVARPFAARAQQSAESIKRIGVIVGYSERDRESQVRMEALRDSLRKRGWIDGRNIAIVYRWDARGPDSLRHKAAELVATRPDLIVSAGSATTKAVMDLTREIPIVFVNVSDPIAAGFSQSLAHPNRNATGFANYEYELGGKWLELLKEVAPRTANVAVILNSDTAANVGLSRAIRQAAPDFGMRSTQFPVRGAADIEGAFGTFSSDQNGGVIVLNDAVTTAARDLIIDLAGRYRIPAIYPFSFYPKRGGLISYGVDSEDQFRSTADYVDRILRGDKPANLPIQQPTKLEMVINLKTAKAIGLTVPSSLLARADEVIE